MGKTVLLNYLRAHADNQGWFTIRIEGEPEAQGFIEVREKLSFLPTQRPQPGCLALRATRTKAPITIHDFVRRSSVAYFLQKAWTVSGSPSCTSGSLVSFIFLTLAIKAPAIPGYGA